MVPATHGAETVNPRPQVEHTLHTVSWPTWLPLPLPRFFRYAGSGGNGGGGGDGEGGGGGEAAAHAHGTLALGGSRAHGQLLLPGLPPPLFSNHVFKPRTLNTVTLLV